MSPLKRKKLYKIRSELDKLDNFLIQIIKKRTELVKKVLELKDRSKIIVVQIAGMIARRIVCDINNNQKVNAGDRFGLIKFGSRVDLFLPKNYTPMVTKDQIVIGGETIISNPDNIKEIIEAIKK